MDNNVILASFGASNLIRTRSAYQYDYGMILKFEGVELPTAYEVHFSNSDTGNSVTQLGNADGVTIPDSMFTTGESINAWLYLHTGEDDGETVYTAIIPVLERAKPHNGTPTPVQQDIITEAIAVLNEAIEQTEANVLHYPKIVGGYWYVWDAENEQWVNTEVHAEFVGSFHIDSDGYLVMTTD